MRHASHGVGSDPQQSSFHLYGVMSGLRLYPIFSITYATASLRRCEIVLEWRLLDSRMLSFTRHPHGESARAVRMS